MTPSDPTSANEPRPAPLRRPGSFAVSVLIALALNAVVLTAVAVAVQTWRVPAHAARQVSWITAVSTARNITEREPAESSGPPSAVESRPQVEIPRPQKAPAAPTASPKTPPEQPEGGSEVRFYKYREVDRTAEPDADWNLDAGVLDSAGIQALVFEVFVGATGDIVACSILEPADLAQPTRNLLEERLRSTIVKPAIRAGMQVASVRRIEVSVESSGP